MNGTQSLLELVVVFDRAEIPYMIVGSYSSNYYGIPRSTKDADLVVHLPSAEWAKLPDILPEGIEMDDQTSFEMVTSTRRELLRVKDSLFQIELFRLSDDPHDRSRFERREWVEIFSGVKVFLPTAEDVIVQKLRWGLGAKRPKDFADVVAVMQVQGQALDWPYIEKWCGEHGTMGGLAQAKAKADAAWEDDETT
ncbi:MAG: nucleotidyl transferase AbiEii/AbiGii toxin family protein [Luteolibacter sp.]|uniref:nucleotidyl transferase AbiEii/AbiGii toxin family protein n=1 Tax=Luteolibacter sp. TaxID=1962973 RepID=UPI0032631DF9